MSLTPIYDDLLREFEGIIEQILGEAATAVTAAATAAAEPAPAEPSAD